MSARLFACDEESPRQESCGPTAMSQVVGSPLPRISAMSVQKRFNDTEAEALPVEMLELGRLIDSMKGPERENLVLAFNRVSDSIQRRRRILNLVQEALSQLRLDVKYLMFDLETTRRERDQLQSQLEEEDTGF
jgi:hypothetical protein